MVEDQVIVSRTLPIAVVLTIMLYLGGALFPIFGALIGLAAMAPGIYLRFQTTLRWPPAVMVVAVVGLLFLGFRTASPVAVYFFEFGLSSLILDDLLRRRRFGVETLFMGAAVTTFAISLVMAWLSSDQGVTPVLLTEQFLLSNIEAVYAIYENAGVSADQLAVLRQAAEEVVVWAGLFFPTLLFIAFFVIQAFGFGAARVFYDKRYACQPEILHGAAPFSRMQLPPQLVWILIVSLAAVIFLPLSGLLHVVLINCAGILLFAYLIQGFAILQFAFESFSVGRIPRFFLFFIFLAFQFLFVFFILLGVFDIWFDFRSRIARRQQGLKE
ncbi:MAG: DUF2232 domain-containing protein [Deltaproteobacteria bacterium]|nr:DUF2232 domain-containing protein [Deltaproteobacteria bacterium]